MNEDVVTEEIAVIGDEPTKPITPSVFVQPSKVRKQAIVDFAIEGFREVKKGEIITISLDVLRDFCLLDKVK